MSWGRWLSLALLLSPCACRESPLHGVNDSLIFASPDDPTGVAQVDAGVVQIEFGPVVVGTTKTLTLQFASLGSGVTLGSTTMQGDGEFRLPFVEGTSVGIVPSQITVSFSPTSLGDKTAVFQLVDYAATAEATTFELTGTSVTNGLVVTPNPFDFGHLEVGQQSSVTLSIANEGRANVVLAVSPLQATFQSSDGGPSFDGDAVDGGLEQAFSLGTPSRAALAPGDVASLVVTFLPTAAKTFHSSFSLNGFTANPVELSGTGLDTALVVESPVDFGYVQLLTSFQKSVVVQNLSDTQTYKLTLFPQFTLPDEDSEFHLSYPVAPFPMEILPQRTAQIALFFEPTDFGFMTETMFVATDDPRATQIQAQLQGWGGGPHLHCASPLIFGPVAVGYGATESELCVNAGSDIPGHPEITLKIAQANLGTDNPAFTPTLLLPDGGPAGPKGAVSLKAQESATIQVAFRPEDAGLTDGRLTVVTNDGDDADAGAALEGEGVVPGICSLALRPTELSFNEVTQGAAGVLQFEIDNVGQDYCILTNVNVDPSSDSAYSLVSPNPPYVLLSFAGNTDNPVGLPTAVRADVQFAPTELEALATGTADVTVVNAVPPNQSVGLAGVCSSACLNIQPSSENFGKVGFSTKKQHICYPVSQAFTVTNLCPEPVTVSAIDLSPGLDAPAQFALTKPPATPLTLDAGDDFAFQVDYHPTQTGESVEAVNLTSSEFPSTPYLITLQADAVAGGVRTDSFPVTVRHVDIAWILDEDDDYPQIQNVRALLPDLFASLDQAQVDYQMAVTSTDTCATPNSDQGAFEPCDHCLSAATPDPLFITPATANPILAMSGLLDDFDIPPQLDACTLLNGDEHFFDAIASAFSPTLLNGHNAGFLRSDAYLAIVVVNGDDEDDANDAVKGRGPYLTTELAARTLVKKLKPNPAMASVSYVNAGLDSLAAGNSIAKLVTDTGGVEVDINQPVGKAAFLSLLTDIDDLGVFRLKGLAVYTGPFEVAVDGVTVGGWTYDRTRNAIVFQPGELPVPGSTVTVTYPFSCP